MSLRSKVVFVDPDDDSCPYWWPALVVPNEYLHLFQQTINEQVPVNGTDLVVCYFEDGSFSVVPESAIKPFSPSREPFTLYQKDPATRKVFLTDRAVIRATKFCTDGIVPLAFTWLHPNTGTDGRLIENNEEIEIGVVDGVERKEESNEIKSKNYKMVNDKKNDIEKIQNTKRTSNEKIKITQNDSKVLSSEKNKIVLFEKPKIKEIVKNYSSDKNPSIENIKSEELLESHHKNETKIVINHKGKRKRNIENEVADKSSTAEYNTKTEKEMSNSNSPPRNLHEKSTEASVETFTMSRNSLFLNPNQSTVNISEFKVIKSLFPTPKIQIIKKILGEVKMNV